MHTMLTDILTVLMWKIDVKNMNKLIKVTPTVQKNSSIRSLLVKIFKQIDRGKGNYSVDRHKEPMLDIDTILKEAEKLDKTD